MARYELQFRIDAPRAAADAMSAVLGEDSERVRARIYGALKLKPHSVAWVNVKLGTPKGDAALQTLIEERRSGRAVVGSATLAEFLDEEEIDASQWFLLHTRQDYDSFNLWDEYPRCRAGTLPRVHALNHNFVSQAFVTECERAQLTGIDFLRCQSRGRKAGPPWFAALAAQGLGNGLDHPWFDRPRWTRHVEHASMKRTSGVGDGQSHFHQFWLKRDAIDREPLVQRMLELCPLPEQASSGLLGLTFAMVGRYSASAQPTADFAYARWGEDGPNREGKMMRFRLLAASRRAREALLDAGLFKEKELWRDEIVPPMYSGQELAALRSRERDVFGRP